MNFNVPIDWKSFLAIGATAVGIIFAVKLDSESTEKVLIQVINSCTELAVAVNSNR